MCASKDEGFEVPKRRKSLSAEEKGRKPKSGDRKRRSSMSADVNLTAFEMFKAAYSLSAQFTPVVEKKNDEPDILETCDILMKLWTNKRVGKVDTNDIEKALNGECSDDAFLPPLVGISRIMDKPMRKKLIRELPACCQEYPWHMAFNTDVDGFSLAEFYRKVSTIDSMALLLIEDMKGTKFGALLSDRPKISERYYGEGQSFLFTFKDGEFKVFRWSGINSYIIWCTDESIHIGAGDGNFGILVDDNLNKGSSERCQTFDNEVLSSTTDFQVKAVECWGFDMIEDEEISVSTE